MTLAGRNAQVTFTAVIHRLNRKLEKEKKAIRSPRGRTDRSTLGDFYLLDTTSNLIVDMKLTPKGIEEMARERGVLAEWEKVK
jgi:hypothetical protein